LLFVGFGVSEVSAQSTDKKQLEIEDLTLWNEISRQAISHDGRWVVYTLKAEDTDPTTIVYDGRTGKEARFERADDFSISHNSSHLVFMIHPPEDTIKDMRRRKVKKADLPGDTLGIYHLTTGALTKVADVKNFKLPEEWNDWLAYLTVEEMPVDTAKGRSARKGKKEFDFLVIKDLNSGVQYTMPKVKEYELARTGPHVAMVTAGRDSTLAPGVYEFTAESKNMRPLFRTKGTYKRLTYHESGSQLAFVADLDTTDNKVRPYGLYHYKSGQDSAHLALASGTEIMEEDWTVSEHLRLQFSEDGSKLYFGLAPPPFLPDTTLLEEEIPVVEVWSSSDERLYTQQNVQLNQDKRRAYLAVFHTATGKLAALGSPDVPDVDLGAEGNAPVALGSSDLGYQKMESWEGSTYYDLYRIDVASGKTRALDIVAKGRPAISPAGQFFYWYSEPDTAWMAYEPANDKLHQLTSGDLGVFYDELNDRPMHPSSYRLAGWLEQDAAVIIYDRYDLWRIDPSGRTPAKRLTKGREAGITYRYIDLDREERFIPTNAKLLLHTFNHQTKGDGYAWFDPASGAIQKIQEGNYALSSRPIKAEGADRFIYTKEDFRTFPDLIYGEGLSGGKQISQANPQQEEYRWGNIELYEWTSLDGQQLQGLLVKPDDFDPNKKYPLIVNFYERSSDGLYNHRAPQANRSTINYTYYTSRGYVIFNPDIVYRIGYPGESCYNSVMSGITSLLDAGFIDRDRIGVQGHSWGGYQIAHLLTKTNMFRCAESGAPVVNMVSAYGGIRWGSGMSRMFQYEHTQSRIGGTLWDYPLRYLENSPIFEIDKINTPVLILHNDNDSAVPWYQGIEFFTAMRRLDKKAWMLNYNGEPHWPLKLANRKDFQKRMSQFFDHYLMNGPLPSWMERGVPAIEKGISMGYEETMESKMAEGKE
jgi:dipeptidyl aminopeptidase/acylaminoacyl peptidase